MQIFKYAKRYYLHIVAFILTLLTLPLFLYKLGQSSLISWDEAWYAEIARNILKTGNIINLSFAGNPFTDHPPAGFWLIALSYKIFGINEFWTRFPSALAGLTSMILLFFLGKKLFNPLVGLISSITLSSTIWFVYRSRSGDLDIFLTMFFILTILLALKAIENKRYLLPFAISLILLFLTKTMIPLIIIPSLLLIFSGKRTYKWPSFILPLSLFFLVAGGWFLSKEMQDNSFIRHYMGIGLVGVTFKSSYLANVSLAKEYLHSGIGKWFWPSLISLIFSAFLKQKRFFIFILFFVSFMIPIIFSPKIQIWHLIPIFPFLILVYFGFVYTMLDKYFKPWKYSVYILFIIFNLIIYLNQIKLIWYQFIDIPAFVSDEAILSKEASRYPQRLMIDGDFVPVAIFYSCKTKVYQIQIEWLPDLFKSNDNFLMITRKGSLTGNTQISPNSYHIIKEDRDKVLLLHKTK